IVDTEENITELALQKTSLRMYPKNTVLVAMYGGFNQIGRTGILGIEATINQALSAISVNREEVDPHFLLNWLNAKVGLWKNLAGSSRKDPNITSKDVGDFPFVKIPLQEQRAIAHILGLMDESINKNNQLITQKEQRKKWLMQQLLTGKKRLKGFENEWKEYHLEEVFEERAEAGFNNLPLLSVGQNGVYPQSESDKKDTSNEDKSKYKRICPGDIGYNTMRMWQGRSALSQLEGIVSPAYTIVTPKRNANSNFFAYLFKTPKMMNLFWRNSQGLVDDTLNCKFKDFKIIKVHLPEKEEQTAIAKVLMAADKEIQLLKTKTEKLKEKKKWLMQILLTGKKRLKVKE
ncbi:MAG: restriction endonuclease subunit S, partial [Cytophagales bacterium]